MNIGTLGVYVATRSSEAHIGQFLLSSGVAFTSRLPCVKTVQQLRPAFVGSDISYVRYPTFIRYFRVEPPLEPVGVTILATSLRARGLRSPTFAFIPARFIRH